MNLFHPTDAARAALTETTMRAADYRPERRRALKWPRLLARFNYRKRRAKGARACD